MGRIDVPGPEPNWEPAAQYQGGKRNPASQYSLWQWVEGDIRLVGSLAASLESLAARLRLDIEQSWADPGPVDVALFRIGAAAIALCAPSGRPDVDTSVWVANSVENLDEAMDSLLEALGLPRTVLDLL